MLDFRIHTFLAVCKTMNFTKAAQELNITQPAVSQHMKFLEDEYGAKLFDYNGKSMYLTEAGMFLQSAATTMVHDEIYLYEKMAELKGKTKKLAFGATLTIGEFVMPKVLAGYLARHPDTPVDMRVANTHKLLEMLDGGEVDFALVEGYFAKKEYDYLTYMRDRFVAVCAPGYPFHGPVRTVEDLLEERLIVREAGSGTRGILEKYLEGRNLCVQDFSSRVEMNNIHAGLALVQEGCGITFLYEAAAREALLQGRLCEIPLEEFGLFHEFTFVWRRGSIFSDYYRQLFTAMRQAGETGVR